MIEVPQGYRVERHERLDEYDQDRQGQIREILFEAVRMEDGDVVSDPKIRWSSWEQRYSLNPGFTRADIRGDEARARAAALLLAADDLDRLNGRNG